MTRPNKYTPAIAHECCECLTAGCDCDQVYDDDDDCGRCSDCRDEEEDNEDDEDA